jgi:hypothetical protein
MALPKQAFPAAALENGFFEMKAQALTAHINP